MSRVNGYRARCIYCSSMVPANGGVLLGSRGNWSVAHLACHDEGSAQVNTTYFPSTNTTLIRNRRGRCEDAPCCGCCNY